MHKQDDKKGPRNLLKDVKVNEVSFVGRGANQGARQSLFKTEDPADIVKRLFMDVMRDMKVSEEAEKLLSEMLETTGFLKRSLVEIMEDPSIDQRKNMLNQSIREFASVMASMVDNSQLTKEFEMISKAEGGKTEEGKVFPAGDYAYVPDKEKPSTWKLRLTSTPGGGPDARIVGMAIAALGAGFRGQKVQIPDADRAGVISRVKAAWKKANPDKSDEDMPAVLKKSTDDKEDSTMKEEIKKLTDTVNDLQARLTKSELRASMTDDHRAHYDKLQGDAQEAFGKAKPEERDEIVKKANAKDEVITIEGETFRKSDVGEATFRVLQKQQARIDKESNEAKTERDARIKKDLEAEAEKEFPHLAGTPAEKAEMLKAIRAMPKEAGDKQMAMMKSADEAMAKQLKEIGQGGQGDETGAESKLQKMASDRAAKENITIAKAYSLVLDTPEGAKLYEESLRK